MQEILIEALMTKEVICAGTETKLKEAIASMRENAYSCLVVTDNGIPVGVITEQDIVRILENILKKSNISSHRVSEFMSFPPVVLKLTDTLFEALEISQTMGLSHIPVVDAKGEIAGLVAQSNLIQTHFKIIEKQRKNIEDTIAARTQELLTINEHLRMLALEDSLLCIGNRRAMEVDLDYTHETAKRYNRAYSVVLFDVDYFKQYNDYYGHLEGDKLLKRVAGYLKQSIRQPDRIYRYGGEEFLLLLPETTIENVPTMAQRLVTGLADLTIPHCKTPLEVVTISGGLGAGIAGNNKQLGWRDVLEEADRGLYRAKRNGRNQIAMDRMETLSDIS